MTFHAHKLKTFSFLAAFALVFASGGLFGAQPDDRVVIYDMKDDPTLPQFVGNAAATGFYGLEIDEYRREGTILFRVGDLLYRSDFDLKIKGDQLILKNKKRQKTLIREKKLLASGKTEEIIYPVECPPEKGGWRHGPSFGRHLVRPNDDEGRRLIVGSARLEFQTAMQRCKDMGDDCGSAGCEEWGAAVSSAAVAASTGPAVASPPVKLTFNKALLEAKLNGQELLITYKDDISAVMPSRVKDLTVAATGYRTTAYPYPGITDPIIEQRGFAIGVVSKTYSPDDRSEPVVLEYEPLYEEFQAPAPTKCGAAWEAGPNKTIFELRGLPAMFIQTPATGNSTANSMLIVCRQTSSISIQSQSYRTQEYLTTIANALP